MGRPERPVDPDGGPVHQFAADLRALRQQAGNPTYRELAERSHYSPSALSRAASGYALPTLAVTIGFVTACGGDPEPWRRRWQEVAEAIGQVPDESDEASVSEDTGYDVADEPRPPATRRGPFGWRPTRSRRLVVPLAATVLVAGVTTVILTTRHPAPRPVNVATLPAGSSEDSGLPKQPAADGVDPKRSGCAPDGVTIDSTSLIFPAGRLAGTVELRYSARCHVAWTRFVPAPTGRGPGDTVTVAIARPADHAEIPFTITYGDEAVWSDVLRTSVGCVVAEAWVVTGGHRSPTAATGCRGDQATPPPSR